MKWTKGLVRDDAKPGHRWPEKVNRKIAALVLITILVGTPAASMTIFSKHIDDEVFDIQPDSYHAIYFGFYGPAKIEYSERLVAGFYGWSQVSLLVMDRINFERFKAGSDYEYTGSNTVSYSSSLDGYTAMIGPLWELFFVFVNEGPEPARVEFRADSTVYFSLAAALLPMGALAGAGYVVLIRPKRHKSVVAGAATPQGRLSVRQIAILEMTGVVGVTAAATIIIGHLIPTDGWLFMMIDPFRRIWIGIMAGMAVAFALRIRLCLIDATPKIVLAQLAKRLRVSGYMVTEKRQQLNVQISSTSAVNIIAKPVASGTRVSYRIMVEPSGWMIVLILVFAYWLAPFVIAFILFLMYRVAVFASDRILPRLTTITATEGQTSPEDPSAMLVECLSEGWRLSEEAYKASKSNYEDSVILLVLASLALSFLLSVRGMEFMPGDLEGTTRATISLLICMVTWTILSVTFWQLLKRRSQPELNELRSWATKLETALHREVAKSPPIDGEPSAFEVIAESYMKTPNWLRIRRKGGRYREPVEWILIFMLGLYAVTMALIGISGLLWGIRDLTALSLAVSVILGGMAVAIYVRWRMERRREDEYTMNMMTDRFEALKSEMEAYLRSV